MTYYNISSVTYLYKDQYGKQVFSASKDDKDLDLLMKTISKHKSINPVFKKEVNSSFIIKFNDTKHLFKPRLKYNLIYFIHKNINKKNNKTYINLHISDVQQIGKKEVSMIKIEDI